VRISFYAPLKSPDHPVPSGDRRMARLLMTALRSGGHQVALASDFRSYEGSGNPGLQDAMAVAGRVEAEHIVEVCLSQPPEYRPNVWFTYHIYYKAPDYLGPVVSDALKIPYIVAEPSHAPKRADGPWHNSHVHVSKSLEKVDCAFCLTRHDMACVEPVLASPERMVYLPPFLDSGPFLTERSGLSKPLSPTKPAELKAKHGLSADVILVAVGMMRPGDKFESYRQLAAALDHLEARNWQLAIIGDGEMRSAVEELFRKQNEVGKNVVFLGEQSGDAIAEIYRSADIYVWPAAGEAYGMALLEAQATGLPVIAGNLRGVPDVVRDGETALLVAPDDAAAFAAAIDQLIMDVPLREALGAAAARFVAGERTVDHAARILDNGLQMASANRGTA
jgi:glycosyltransferase involved in cell wall biosynthesis